jgi:DNA-binding transcriptional LysR family regulator
MLDMAIIASPTNIEHLNTIPLGEHAVAWVASPEFDLHTRRVEPEELTTRVIFTNPSPSNMFSMLMDWFGSYSLHPRRIHTCNSLSTIAGLVGAGAGIAILPTCMIEEELLDGSIVPINVSQRVPPQDMTFAFSKGARVAGTLEVLDAARAVAQETHFLV